MHAQWINGEEESHGLVLEKERAIASSKTPRNGLDEGAKLQW